MREKLWRGSEVRYTAEHSTLSAPSAQQVGCTGRNPARFAGVANDEEGQYYAKDRHSFCALRGEYARQARSDGLEAMLYLTREEFIRRIDWSEDNAVIRMDGRRKVFLDVEAMGALRKSLVDTVGLDRARGVFRRFGFACGQFDFEQTRIAHPDATSEEMLALGPQAHMLMGHVHVELTRQETDRELGRAWLEGIWRNSFEAENHVKTFGRSRSPVCWTLEGYASGWASAWLGQRAITLETRCVGMGDRYCTFTIRTAEEWGPQAKTFVEDLADVDLGRTISLLEQLAADLRMTQTRLVGSEAKYRAIFEDAPDMMMLCDPVTGRVLDVNRRVVENLEYSREHLLKMSLRDMHPPSDHENIARVIGPNVAQPVRSLSMTLLGKDSRRFTVEAAFSIVPFAGTTILQAIYHDVTEYHKTQQALREAEELAHIGRMASAVAHEIRNPLSAIVSGIRLLTSTQRSEDERSVIFETILTESERLDNTLNDFLQFARPRSPRRRPVDLSRMVKDLLRIIWGDQGTVNAVTLRTEWPDELPVISCDGDQIRQVFWNILLNALQAMDGKGELTVRIAPVEQQIRVEIADTGPGIPPEELSEVFEPFHTTKPRGTGLGLPIARRIIQGHGGTIRIESVVNRGTTVVFSLPLGDPDAEAQNPPGR